MALAANSFSMEHSSHDFGGKWTEQKLDVLANYLIAYQEALKNQPFKCAYIDAFAGSGVRGGQSQSQEGTQQEFFEEFEGVEPRSFRAGSVRRALEIPRPFDRYIFIERSQRRAGELAGIRDEFAELRDRIRVIHGEANKEIQRLCSSNWAQRRAVLFLDPYGLQVDWGSIEAIARTKAIDMWLLFPLGVGLNRMLPKDGGVPEDWRAKINSFLGTEDWYDAFYSKVPAPSLFGDDDFTVVKAGYEAIGQFFLDRLRTVFPAVSPEPGILMNSCNCPLYLLIFAAGNERGGRVALKIANHLLKGMS